MGVSAGALRAGEAAIELSLVAGKAFASQLNGIKSKLTNGFKGLSVITAGGAGAAGGLFGSAASASFASLTANAGRLRNSLSQINQLRFSGLLSLRNLLVGSLAGASLLWPIKLAANIEVATAQLTVFTGSAATARAMLLELQQFSSVSIIPFENLSQTAALLLRYGQSASDAVANTKALAVIAAGDSDEFDKLALAFAQVGSAGRLQGEEMRQFKNTGFNPLREIAERTGETMEQVKDRMEAGNISFAEVSSALQAAVGPAGRFNGLLEAISGTLLGQMRQAFAGLKMAVLPLGEQMLAPLTRFFRAINGAMPQIQAFVKANAAVYKSLLKVSAVVGGVLLGLTALSLTVGIIDFLFSGLTAVLSLTFASLMILLNPITLLAAGIGFLIYKFTQLPQAVGNAVSNLGAWFDHLLQIAKDTFSGISDALQAGDIQLAAEILWQGLHLAWLQGTDKLHKIWLDFKDIFMRTTLDITFAGMKAWANFAAAIEFTFTKMKSNLMDRLMELGAFMESIGKTKEEFQQIKKDVELAKSTNKQLLTADVSKILADEAKARADLDAAQKTANDTQDKASSDAANKAKAELKAAQLRLNFLRLAAAAEAANTPDAKKWFGANAFTSGFGDAMATASKNTQPLPALFDTRLSSQIFGASSDQELAELKKIERNTRNANRRSGLPVV